MNSELRQPFAASFADLAELAAADADRYAEMTLADLGSEIGALSEAAGASAGEVFRSDASDAGEAASPPAAGANSINLSLTLNGAAISGEPMVVSLGRQNTIECLSYQQAIATAREAGSGIATGRRQYAPIVIAKRIDKSSPLLAKGLTQNQVAEGTFKFYRPKPTGDGTTGHYYTVTFQQGRISALKQSTADGVVEEVAFVFQSISWTYVNGGISHQDTWNTAR